MLNSFFDNVERENDAVGMANEEGRPGRHSVKVMFNFFAIFLEKRSNVVSKRAV